METNLGGDGTEIYKVVWERVGMDLRCAVTGGDGTKILFPCRSLYTVSLTLLLLPTNLVPST